MTTDTHDMLLIHRVVRREIGQLPGMLRRAAGEPVRAARLTTHIEEMLDFLHTHHSGEDEFLWPVLRPRVSLDAELIDRMEAQHGPVDQNEVDEIAAQDEVLETTEHG